MNELEIFKNDEFGEVRVVDVKGEPWFVGKDICEAFGDTNYRRSLSKIEEEEKGVSQIATLGGKQNMTIINESGLYSLLFSMEPQKANMEIELVEKRVQKLKKFKKWVTSEVLPTIRKTGGYVNNDELFLDTYLPNLDETSRLLFKSTLEVVRKQNEIIEQQKPLVAFANTVAKSSDNIDMNEMAKLIANEKIKLGRNRLFEILRSKKILMHNNTPYQKYIDSKWFKLIETTKSTPYGDKVFTKTLVTGIGQIKIIEMLKEMLA